MEVVLALPAQLVLVDASHLALEINFLKENGDGISILRWETGH